MQKCVVGIGGIDIYNEIYVKKENQKCMAGPGIEPGTPSLLVVFTTTELNSVSPKYHIPPLQSFSPLTNTQLKQVHPVMTY